MSCGRGEESGGALILPVFSGDKEQEPALFEARLAFVSATGGCLCYETRHVERGEDLVEQAEIVLRQLIEGPKQKGLFSAIPDTTKLKGLFLEGGIAYVNLSNEVIRDHPGGTLREAFLVYSIVNTLVANFQEIEKVQILVEGEPVDTIKNHLDVSTPLRPNFSFVKEG
jgi:spore germination protein GerM